MSETSLFHAEFPVIREHTAFPVSYCNISGEHNQEQQQDPQKREKIACIGKAKERQLNLF